MLLFAGSALAQNSQCSAAEKQNFTQWVKNPPNPIPPDQQSPAADRMHLDKICMPNGQRAYLVAKGVLPPTIVGGGPREPIRKATNGQKSIVLRLDANGVPTVAYLLDEHGVLGPDVVKVFAGWQFAPATFKGRSLAVVFKIDLVPDSGAD